jgi:hypothetical protein
MPNINDLIARFNGNNAGHPPPLPTQPVHHIPPNVFRGSVAAPSPNPPPLEPLSETDPFKIQYACQGDKMLVSVLAPTITMRSRVNICFVLDNSGSMGNGVTAANGESDGLSRLDIAKHSIKTVIATLGDDDMCSLVVYSTSGIVVFQHLRMTAAGKQTANDHIDPIYPDGSTNMWAGMSLGFQ